MPSGRFRAISPDAELVSQLRPSSTRWCILPPNPCRCTDNPEPFHQRHRGDLHHPGSGDATVCACTTLHRTRSTATWFPGRPGAVHRIDVPYNPSSPYWRPRRGADMLVRACWSCGVRATISNCSNNWLAVSARREFIPRQITNAYRRRPSSTARAPMSATDPRRLITTAANPGQRPHGRTWAWSAPRAKGDNLTVLRTCRRVTDGPRRLRPRHRTASATYLRYAIDPSTLYDELCWRQSIPISRRACGPTTGTADRIVAASTKKTPRRPAIKNVNEMVNANSTSPGASGRYPPDHPCRFPRTVLLNGLPIIIPRIRRSAFDVRA